VNGYPADAYKFYEYNYQEEYMPHRYLPEHVVLNDIPKPPTYTEPVPRSEGWRSHALVRFHMVSLLYEV
jgi:hypothetical protein